MIELPTDFFAIGGTAMRYNKKPLHFCISSRPTSPSNFRNICIHPSGIPAESAGVFPVITVPCTRSCLKQIRDAAVTYRLY